MCYFNTLLQFSFYRVGITLIDKISIVREYFIGLDSPKMISREILSHKDLNSVAFYNISRLLYEIRFMVSFFHGNQLKFI